MSDQPPNKTDEAPPADSGWHEPSTPGAWHAPEKPEVVGWRVPALPKDLDESPQETGAWHLPKAEDTVFTPEDQTDIVRSEDELPESMPAEGQQIAPEDAIRVPAPEDVLFAAQSAQDQLSAQSTADKGIKAPEDWMSMLEVASKEEDDAGGTMSELVALANLQQETGNLQVEIGDQLGDDSDLDDDEDEDSGGLDLSQLSLAERASLQPQDDTAGVTGLSPADYARQQMEKLAGGGDPNSMGALLADSQARTESMDATGDLSDPADYARQQLQQLQQDNDDFGGSQGFAPAQPQIEPLNPRELDLLRRFTETQNQVRQLRQMEINGQISQEEFIGRLRDLMILDDDQNWWMMGVETDTWYRSEGEAWVPDVPDVIQRQQEVESHPGTARFNQSSREIDWLTDDQSPQPTHPVTGGVSAPMYDEFSSGIPRGETGYSPPIPTTSDVPIHDPQATVANPNVFAADELNDPYSQNTVPNASFSAPTIPAEPVDYGNYSGIESPIDPTEPPVIDEEISTPLYDAAATEKQASTARLLLLGGVAVLILILLAGAGFIVGALMWYDGIVSEWEVQIAALENYEPPFQSVRILDRTGREIGVLGEDGNDRREVTISEMDPLFIHAVLSLEDQRYFEHPGWDFIAIARAFWQNITSGEIESGASTITQQIARNFVLQSTAPSADRKVTEIIIAGELTRRYSKSFLLELYLNEIALGNQTFGVEAASQFYFETSAANLNLPQSALLASLISAPSANNPVANRTLAFQNMRAVMQRMAEVGCLQFQHAPYDTQPFCVTPADVNSADSIVAGARIEARPFLARQFGVEYPHFIQLVQNELELLFGTSEIYQQGFTVTTTLDSDLQDHAQQALISRVNQLGVNGVNTGSVMVTDPVNCTVLAMIGSPDFNNTDLSGQTNGALTYQQPGSSIKPLIYATALQGVDLNGNGTIDTTPVDTNGDGLLDAYEYLTPASMLWDVETTYTGTNGQPYTPVNFDGQYHGPRSLRNSLQNSYNVPSVRTLSYIGVQNFINMSESLGIRYQEEAQFNLTTALGSTEVRLYDMMVAYGAFANRGQRCQFITPSGSPVRLRTIQSIVNSRGEGVAIPEETQMVQAVSPQVAFLMSHILSDNNARAEEFTTTSPLIIPGLEGRLAAKSGTSDGPRDLWTMGYTSNLVVGVWLGRVVDDVAITNTSGSLAAGPLWNDVMRFALQNTSPAAFVPPSTGIRTGQVCDLTGVVQQQGAPACPSGLRNEYWLEQLPPPTQSLVVELQIDAWTGLIANENCSSNIVTRTYINVPDQFVLGFLNNTQPGRQYLQSIGLTAPVVAAPTAACDFNTTIPQVSITNPNGGQTVQGVVQINGQISGNNFQSYQLEYATTAAPTQFFAIGGVSTQQQPTTGTLGTWDTTTVPNGDYILRLTVTSNTGGRIERIVQPVSVNNLIPTATPTQQPALPTSPPITDPNFTPIPFDPVDP